MVKMLLRPRSAAAPRRSGIRAVLLASIAALVVTSFDVHAAPALVQSSTSGGQQQLAPADAIEFGARKRKRARGNPAAGLAVMGMMIGTIGAVIAAQQRREAYEAAYNRRYYYPYGYPYGDVKPYVYHHHHYHPHYHHHPRIGW